MIRFDINPGRLEPLRLHFRECTPRILVVTDGSLNGGTGGFGLSHFIDILSSTQIHGMTPIVEHRDRHAGGPDQAFDDLSISKFDVVFLFGIETTGSALSASALSKVQHFMEDGGGLFSTGDHEDLGTGMSGDIPRVRQMRYWAAADTPDASDSTRLTTNLPGNDVAYTFADQSDEHPQRLYPNFAVGTDGFVLVPIGGASPSRPAHPLIRLAGGGALDVYPDHPHEGECRIPTDLSTTFDLDGSPTAEWPGGPFFFMRPRPRAVAYAMSAGNGFEGPDKSAVVPRSFIAIAAYNGHLGSVGRVVTDATWHHYVNINLTGMRPGGVSNTDMQAIEAFWSNMVNWLMPATVRRCLWPWLVVSTLVDHPLLEEIEIPEPSPKRVRELVALGSAVVSAVDERPGSVGTDAVTDAVAMLAGTTDRKTDDREFAVNDRLASKVGLALVGAHFAHVAHTLEKGGDLHDHDGLERTVKALGDEIVEAVIADERSSLEKSAAELDRTRRLLAEPVPIG